NPVVWFEIYVQDMARARAFYETVFQGKLENLPSPNPGEGPAMEMCVFPMDQEGGGAMGTLVKMEGMPSGGSTLVYFGCDDCAVEESRVVAAGGRIERSKMSIGEHGFISLVVDTEGNMIGLHSME